MLEFFKKGDEKVEVTVTLDRPGQSYFPGDTVSADISIEAKEPLKIREARVALVARDMCLYQDNAYAGGDLAPATTNWSSFDQEITRQTLMGAETIGAGSVKTFNFSATFPDEAAPTCSKSAFIKLNWLIKVTLDRPMAPDINAEAEIEMGSVVPDTTSPPGEYGQSNEPEQAEMAFYLPRKEWLPGDTIEGELRLTPKTDFDVTEVRLSLAQVETVFQGQGSQYKTKQEMQAATELKLQESQALIFPFSFTIPDDGQATANTGSGAITWALKGVLARHMRPDTYIEEEIFVYSHPQRGPQRDS